MRNLKEMKQLIVDTKIEIAVETMMALSNPSRTQKKAAGAIGVSGAVLGTVGNFMAAGDFLSQAKALTKELFTMTLTVSTGIFFLYVAIAVIMYGISSDPQAARLAKDRIKRAIIAWVAINLIGVIAATVVKLTAGGNNGAGQTTTGI